MAPNLIIPIGIPGCGKSTWVKEMFDLKYAIVSSDAIRKNIFGSLVTAHRTTPEQRVANNQQVFDIFHNKISEHLQFGVDVVADATNLNPFARDRLKAIAKEHGAKTHAILFKNPTEALVRNRERDEDAQVPEDVMMNFVAKYYEVLNDLPFENYDCVTEIGSVR